MHGRCASVFFENAVVNLDSNQLVFQVSDKNLFEHLSENMHQ